ncbi:hypothetical protein MXB_3640, partial [Myxobolus squamalis]
MKSSLVYSGPKTAKPVVFKKIFYLKTHKTASSSLQNIFYRLAEKKRLKIALPLQNESVAFWPYSVNEFNIDRNSYPPDIHLLHSVFDQKKTERIFPKKETFFVTILRNTTTQWASGFSYFGIGKINSTVHELSMDEYLQLKLKTTWDENENFFLSRNPNFKDFGFTNSQLSDDKSINIAISKVEKIFNFVMITEFW